ncbi:galectin-related protein precursor [Biomphalaria pfeifferi]|uniref:Galectin n=1 Tax=Biomphalaria pfeifferi TaxID=112525 RepID=A0AAD8FFR3_BIOPF|nr:galectin-related protein precursor [Biomphalaria pfeifferi]
MDVSTQALNCVNNINCGAMICDKDRKSCYNCFKDLFQGLEFPKSWTWFYLKRKLVILDAPYNQTNGMTREIYPVSSGLMSGDVICLKARLTKFDNLLLELWENGSGITYHFRARCDSPCSPDLNCSSSDCTIKNVVIDSNTNGQWSISPYTSFDYPFVLNQVFTVFFHIGPSSVDVYINQRMFKSFLTSRPPQVIRSIRVEGSLVVHELSV